MTQITIQITKNLLYQNLLRLLEQLFRLPGTAWLSQGVASGAVQADGATGGWQYLYAVSGHFKERYAL